MSFDYYDEYDGSKIFTNLAEFTNLPIDLVNFLVAQTIALFLSGAFRGSLKSASPVLRHTACLGFGLFMGYFCFGRQAIHLALMPTICFFIIRKVNARIAANLVLVVSMIYLSCIHLHRQMYHRGNYTLDISGPLMVITQRVTSLAYSLQDGYKMKNVSTISHSRENGKPLVNGEHRKVAGNTDLGPPLFELPTTLEFFSFALAFQTLMCGPIVFYEDYITFIEGAKTAHMNGNSKPDNVTSPSPRWAVTSKLASSITAAFLHLALVGFYPIDKLKEMADPTSEAARWSAWYLLWFAFASTLVVRCKYYHAWLLADAICNNSGIGYTHSGKWDAVSNVDIAGFELSPNFRSAVSSWNRNTNAWLRRVAYGRLPRRLATAATYGLSAIWHGYHPGYYATFASGALFTIAARKMRNAVRPVFLSTRRLKAAYDVITFTVTRIFMTYATIPFVVLDLAPTMAFYSRFYYSLHFVAIAAILMPTTSHNKRANGVVKTADDKTNGVVKIADDKTNGKVHHELLAEG